MGNRPRRKGVLTRWDSAQEKRAERTFDKRDSKADQSSRRQLELCGFTPSLYSDPRNSSVPLLRPHKFYLQFPQDVFRDGFETL